MKNIDLGKLKNISMNDLSSLMSRAWQRFFKLVVVIFWVLIMSAGAYEWYIIFYGPSWSEAEKTTFLNSKFPENNLKKENLDKVLNKIKTKEEKLGQEVIPVKNIFKAY
jgi:Tfp pilus assembly protein PilO